MLSLSKLQSISITNNTNKGSSLKHNSSQYRDTIETEAVPDKMADTLKLQLQFGGGAELLFDKIKKRQIELPVLNKYFPECTDKEWTIKHLLVWIKDNLLKERPELFLQGDSVRPGILVLINDADWELFGELEYELQNNDAIMFISTLHGG